MIVDLLRNDLGDSRRPVRCGAALFAIEPYSTVFQMTSTVQAQIRHEVSMPELLRACSRAARSPARPSTTRWS